TYKELYDSIKRTRIQTKDHNDSLIDQEDQTGSNSGKLHVSLAGSNPEHMDDEFLFSWIKPG
ncbi:hypothetical protein Tco_0440652, partial [Tanacetum coccineum]